MNAEISAYVPIREKLASELLRGAGKGNEREGIERLLEDRNGTDLARTQRSRRSRRVARGVFSTANIGTYLALTLFPVLPQGTAMRSMFVGQVLALAASTSMASAQPVRWTTYTIPETGTSVDFPSSVFSEEAGQPDGYGRRFQTSDGRANITIQAAPNVANDSPAAFLAKKNPPPRIQYKRVTPRFFAVSSYKGDKVWYDRCNFSRGLVHCVLINYPASEERDWDGIVTRISLSLSGK